MKKIISILLILFLLNYFHKTNNKLNIINSINNKFDGLWFVHSKTFYENKNCQTFNITNQEYFLQIDENFKINNDYYSYRYIIKPINDTFLINNYYTKILYYDKDYILLKIDKEYYLLTSIEHIDDEYEKIYIRLSCALNGILYQHFWQIYQNNC